MHPQLHRPLRFALGCFALCGLAMALWQEDRCLMRCSALGAMALGALALWPAKTPAWGRYGLPLLMLLPLAAELPSGWSSLLGLILVALALGLWAGLGLRQAKQVAQDTKSSWVWDGLGILGLLALWTALGLMGGSLSTLLWPARPTVGNEALMATGVTALVYHHARFLLLSGPSLAKHTAGPR